MKTKTSDPILDQVLDYLHTNPHILDKKTSPEAAVNIRVVHSDTRKRFTEFHRIQVTISPPPAKAKPAYYWIRIVKNKPEKVIHEALTKQHGIMTRLLQYLTSQDAGQTGQFLCCQSVALLPQFRTLITRECNGQYFNSYLMTRIPLLHRDQIGNHFFNCGVWLKKFHTCFTLTTPDPSLIQTSRQRFHNQFGRYPQPAMDQLTLCHNDYSPRNIFVWENGVEVIDFVGVGHGYPEEDIAFFCNYILKARFNLLYSSRFKHQLLERFRKGYGL